MDAAKNEIMNQLFQGNITIHEAVETLGVSEDNIHKMIDDYEYVPTSDEIIKANSFIQDNLEHIENDVFPNIIKKVLQPVMYTDANEILGNHPDIRPSLELVNSEGTNIFYPSTTRFESAYHG